MDGVEVKHFALRYNPPTLCVAYSIAGGKTVLRKISFRKTRGSPRQVCDSLLRKCEDILGPDKVSEEQVRGLVDLLLLSTDAEAKADGPSASEATTTFGDLNGVTEEELLRAKALMNHDFERNRLLPGSQGYEYDRRVDFVPPTEATDWDEDDEDD